MRVEGETQATSESSHVERAEPPRGSTDHARRTSRVPRAPRTPHTRDPGTETLIFLVLWIMINSCLNVRTGAGGNNLTKTNKYYALVFQLSPVAVPELRSEIR